MSTESILTTALMLSAHISVQFPDLSSESTDFYSGSLYFLILTTCLLICFLFGVKYS